MTSCIYPIVPILAWDMEGDGHHQVGVDFIGGFWSMGISPGSIYTYCVLLDWSRCQGIYRKASLNLLTLLNNKYTHM